MDLSEFKIGDDFYLGETGFRCTDIGSRVVVGIALRANVSSGNLSDISAGTHSTRLLTEAETEAGGWLNGPPYDSGELVFDETDISQCTKAPADEIESGTDGPPVSAHYR